MTKELRVISFTRRQRQPRGYVGYETVHYQRLQEKRWWGWKTIDEEIVPSFVSIYLGCYGDTGSWVSKFAKIGHFGRDGKLVPHAA
jgi:hypothetical protein